MRVNVITLVLLLISIISSGLLLTSYYTQKQLNYSVKLQSSAISELIKAREDGRDLPAALAQVTSLNSELRDLITTLRVPPNSASTDNHNQASVGGAQTSAFSSSGSPQIIGMVQVKGDPTQTEDIYENPQLGTIVTGSAAGADLLFYIQKQPGWYQVELKNENTGWIQEERVSELGN